MISSGHLRYRELYQKFIVSDVKCTNSFQNYHQISNISRTNPKSFLSRLAVAFVQSIEAIYQVENEDVVGAAPTGGVPTTSEGPTSLLPTKVRLILEV